MFQKINCIKRSYLVPSNLRHIKDADKLLKTNLKVLETYLKNENLNFALEYNNYIPKVPNESSSESWKCTCYLLHVIWAIHTNIDLDSSQKDDLISLRHQNELLNLIKLVSRYGIVYNLSDVLRQHPIFNNKHMGNGDREQLKTCLLALSKLFSVNLIASSRIMDSVLLEVIAGIYVVEDPELYFILNTLWERTAKENYFRCLLILKSISNLPKRTQETLHKALLGKLVEPGGFKLLILNTVPSMATNVDIPNWKRYDVVAQIVAHKGHSNTFYKQMIEQIFDFVKNSCFDIMEYNLVPAGVVTLRKLCLLSEHLNRMIEDKIMEMYKTLIQPNDVITGLILMEYRELKAFIKIQTILFNGSSFEALPSEILVRYMPLLISLFLLTQESDISKHLTVLISQCLANRKPEGLRQILKTIFSTHENGLQLEHLHARIGIRRIDASGQIQLQIMPPDLENVHDVPLALNKILKSSNNNILIYNCFIQMLMILEETEQCKESCSNEIDLLQSEDELNNFLTRKFQAKISVISCLTDLISFRQFHSQFQENPREVLEFVQNAVERRINENARSTQPDENLPILLAIFQEFIENSNNYSKCGAIKKALETYSKQIKSNEIKHQINQIISLIDGGSLTTGVGTSDYEFARSLMSESQAHLRVYGITQFIKLMSDRNEEALSKKHLILAMAMRALRDEESYTYLNCVRLFVCLTNFMQADVLDTLSAEYCNENESIEFRLKVGEAILKVTEQLGPMCYNYKDILVNCFLHGSRSALNEFRASSMANLSTICRLLSYQVHHFFNEMMLMIESTLQTDEYLPARRASALVLSQLLWGMDNLIDFEDALLPIYRLLNSIVANDKDEKTRVHATNGLGYLKDKCKAFLFPEPKMEKDIKIFGIKDDPSDGKKKGHILEM